MFRSPYILLKINPQLLATPNLSIFAKTQNLPPYYTLHLFRARVGTLKPLGVNIKGALFYIRRLC